MIYIPEYSRGKKTVQNISMHNLAHLLDQDISAIADELYRTFIVSYQYEGKKGGAIMKSIEKELGDNFSKVKAEINDLLNTFIESETRGKHHLEGTIEMLKAIAKDIETKLVFYTEGTGDNTDIRQKAKILSVRDALKEQIEDDKREIPYTIIREKEGGKTDMPNVVGLMNHIKHDYANSKTLYLDDKLTKLIGFSTAMEGSDHILLHANFDASTQYKEKKRLSSKGSEKNKKDKMLAGKNIMKASKILNSENNYITENKKRHERLSTKHPHVLTADIRKKVFSGNIIIQCDTPSEVIEIMSLIEGSKCLVCDVDRTIIDISTLSEELVSNVAGVLARNMNPIT